MFRFVVRVLGGWGKFRQVIFAGPELLHVPGVGEGLSVQFGVTEHLVELGIIIGAVHVGSMLSGGVG